MSLQSSDTCKTFRNKVDICRMFDRIAPRYDLLNHLLSFGQDFFWRRKVAKYLNSSRNGNLEILDLATGTGDLLISLFRENRSIAKAVGLDISANMLAICREKINSHKLTENISLVQADAVRIPFAENSFDVVTIAFGIRNTADTFEALKEMHRVLRPGGMSLILEFSLPKVRIIRGCYLLYLRYLLAMIGCVVSGDDYAYRYLGKTVENFYNTDDFCALMKEAGFLNVQANQLTAGVVCMYRGYKAQESIG
ncbi:MAG: bifunctional demethylmenaquinone methyltransferase/2-methoxy-6-polyprenyl-1,4-benzoquinol methylase UbiE [Sedimentisphaerales bacterium]